MKFKSMRTGKIFNTSKDMYIDYQKYKNCFSTKNTCDCTQCIVSSFNNNDNMLCYHFVRTNSIKFAKLAGYEVIETDKKQSKKENEYDNSINFLNYVASFWSGYLVKEITSEDVSKMIKFYELCKQMKGD